MKLQALLDDHSVTHVRKKKWADPREHLVLPPVVDHLVTGEKTRGVWAKLYGYDGNAEGTYAYTDLMIHMVVGDGSEDDWEIHPRKLRRGIYYRHKTNGKVLLIGNHPHDGACYIAEQYDEANDAWHLITCESSELFEEIYDEVAERLYAQNNPEE